MAVKIYGKQWVQEWNPECRMLRLLLTCEGAYATEGEENTVNLGEYLSEIVHVVVNPKDGYVFEVNEEEFSEAKFRMRPMGIDVRTAKIGGPLAVMLEIGRDAGFSWPTFSGPVSCLVYGR